MAGCREDAEPPVDHPKDVPSSKVRDQKGIWAQSEQSDKKFQRGSPIVEFPAAVPPLSLALLCFRLRGRLLVIDQKKKTRRSPTLVRGRMGGELASGWR